ncbi:PilZ domain-containing protein [Dethiosulfatarculus sandiegensis]|uniref:PilZ domain-containing protein n=1 Tax=Dethiosulfatarculus sandiegensis TaxID=1429043 RepID=A0A0D2J7S6_9BACT|nr:PilZ domain-containing protein [Dethiosulfatarculus sandiegensis]KIX11781.1 hypothetical protein X474_22940 [Dethiosulfatarculus sandiegensis]
MDQTPLNGEKLMWRYPGWTEKDLEIILSPGHCLELVPRRVFEPHTDHKIRKAQILGVHDGDLVLSLPEPPLPTPLLGQPLEVTFLHKGKNGVIRYGYYTLILDTFKTFASRSGAVPAVVVLFPREKDISPTNLRSSQRFRPPQTGDLCLVTKGVDQCRIEDLSFRGIRFSYEEGPVPPEEGAPLDLTLQFNEKQAKLSGIITNRFQNQGRWEICLELKPMGLGLWSDLLVILHGVAINL